MDLRVKFEGIRWRHYGGVSLSHRLYLVRKTPVTNDAALVYSREKITLQSGEYYIDFNGKSH